MTKTPYVLQTNQTNSDKEKGYVYNGELNINESLFYMPPVKLAEKAQCGGYGKAQDWWTLTMLKVYNLSTSIV